jgi:hypothetical protein
MAGIQFVFQNHTWCFEQLDSKTGLRYTCVENIKSFQGWGKGFQDRNEKFSGLDDNIFY